ncbi:MAG: DUF748 domain-containing protein, partial [Methylovulum sp.]
MNLSPNASQRKWISVIIALWVLYTLTGFFLLPAVVRYKLPDIIRKSNGRESSITAVDFDPYQFSLRLQGCEIKEKDGSSFVKFEELYADINVWQSLRNGLFSFAELRLMHPYAHIGRQKDGKFNIEDLLSPEPETQEKQNQLLPFEIEKLSLAGGAFKWRDAHYAQSVDVTVQPIDLEINHINTHPDRAELNISLVFESGAKLDWNGSLALNPLQSEGRIRIHNLQTRQLWEMFLQNQTFMLNKGVNELDTKYHIDYSGGQLHSKLESLQLIANSFALTKNGDASPLIDLEALALHDAHLNIDWTLADGQLQVGIPKGALAIKKFVLSNPGSQKLRLNIDEFALKDINMAIRYKDDFQLNVAQQQIGMKNPVLALNNQQPLKMTAAGINAQLDVEWTQADKVMQVKIPQGTLAMNKFVLADSGAQKQHLEAGAFALKGLNVDIQHKDVLQLNVSLQQIEVKNSSFARNNEQPLKVSAAGITIGPMQISARQMSPHIALEVHAAQDNLHLQKFSLSLPTKRPTLLDVVDVAIGKVRFGLQPRKMGAPEIQLSHDTLNARQLVLSENTQKEALAKVASLSMRNLQFDLEKKRLNIASAASSGADIKAWLDSDRQLNYETLFAAASPAEPSLEQTIKRLRTVNKPVDSSTPSGTAGKWTVTVAKMALENSAIEFQDRSLNPPATFMLTGIKSSAENFSTAANAKFPLRMSALFNDKSNIELNGSATVQPFNAAIDVDVKQFPLKPFQHYANRFLNLDIVNGFLHIDGKLAMNMANPDKPQVSFKGGSSISQFHSRIQQERRDFAKCDELLLQGVDFELQPLRINVAEMQADRPYLRLAIDKDRNININKIIAKQPEAAAAVAAATVSAVSRLVQAPRADAQKSPVVAYDIKKIKLRNGSGYFSDKSLFIPFSARINDLNGFLGGLSSQPDTEGSLVMQGKLFEMAQVDVNGVFKPAQRDSKIAMHFRNMPLPLATPYIAEFAGYKIEKGRMNLDLNYHIVNGQLDSSNKIFIDQLTLGERVESPRAVSLSLRLVAAMLKDSSGKIDIDFPIRGSLEDPHFDIGKRFLGALLNVLTKTIVSPFSALAALAGSDNEVMSYISFKPGGAELDESEITKLDGLVKVFAEQKKFTLDVKGVAYQQEDWLALRDETLFGQLKDRYAKELRDSGENFSEEDIKLSGNDYNRLLADLFIEKYPQLAKRSLFGAPTLINDDKNDFYTVAKQKLREQIAPRPEKLQALASKRG